MHIKTYQTYQPINEEEVRAAKEQVARALNATPLDEASLLTALEHVDDLLIKATKQLHIALLLSRSTLNGLRFS